MIIIISTASTAWRPRSVQVGIRCIIMISAIIIIIVIMIHV